MHSTVVFTFGRFQPLTTGHARVITQLLEVAKTENADHAVYLSQKQHPVTDPLTWDFKLSMCQAAFDGVNFSTDLAIKSPFHALEELSKRYKHVVVIVGADRQARFTTDMTKYAAEWGVESLRVISAGNRDPLSPGVEGISGTLMRQYATNDNYDNFCKNLPNTLDASMCAQIYEEVKKGLKIT